MFLAFKLIMNTRAQCYLHFSDQRDKPVLKVSTPSTVNVYNLGAITKIVNMCSTDQTVEVHTRNGTDRYLAPGECWNLFSNMSECMARK